MCTAWWHRDKNFVCGVCSSCPLILCCVEEAKNRPKHAADLLLQERRGGHGERRLGARAGGDAAGGWRGRSGSRHFSAGQPARPAATLGRGGGLSAAVLRDAARIQSGSSQRPRSSSDKEDGAEYEYQIRDGSISQILRHDYTHWYHGLPTTECLPSLMPSLISVAKS